MKSTRIYKKREGKKKRKTWRALRFGVLGALRSSLIVLRNRANIFLLFRSLTLSSICFLPLRKCVSLSVCCERSQLTSEGGGREVAGRRGGGGSFCAKREERVNSLITHAKGFYFFFLTKPYALIATRRNCYQMRDECVSPSLSSGFGCRPEGACADRQSKLNLIREKASPSCISPPPTHPPASRHVTPVTPTAGVGGVTSPWLV